MEVGVKQFVIFGPFLGLIHIVCHERFGAESLTVKVLFILIAITSMWNFWCFNNLVALIRPVMERSAPTLRVGVFSKFVFLHIILNTGPDAILGFLVKNGYRYGDDWEVTAHTWATIISGFILCVLELPLAMMGQRAFHNDEEMYPAHDPSDHNAVPLDTMAVLEFNGLNVTKFPGLQIYLKAAAAATQADKTCPEPQIMDSPTATGSSVSKSTNDDVEQDDGQVDEDVSTKQNGPAGGDR
jgi:hypothetical protein